MNEHAAHGGFRGGAAPMVGYSLANPFPNTPGVSFPSGCSSECPGNHLLTNVVLRLLDLGVPADVVRECLLDERDYHQHKGNRLPGLTDVGRLHLVAWGASPGEISEIEGHHEQSEPPTAIDYYEKARQRAADSRDRLGVDEQRARNRAASKRYRDSRKGGE